ncbi:MAG TPA: SHD1 domain-containing protein, partial [Lacipirellulaceae bacterium]
MSFHRRLWIICIAIGLLNQSAGWSREWHRTDGSLFCEGKLLSVENGKIRVLADTGATVLIPPNQLSLEDAEYVERALRSRAALVGERVASLPAAENPYDKPTVEPKPPAATPSVQTAGTSKPAAIEQDKFPLTNPNVTTWQG